MEESILRVENVKKYFTVESGILKAVNGVSLEIKRGETLGLVGESGCGKSTLGRMIMRLYKPDEGTITFKGADVWKFNKKEKLQYTKNVQMIFQDPYASLDPLYVVHDIIGEGIDTHKLYFGQAKEDRINALLKMVGLGSEHASRFPHEFSGGQRQRIGIARALSVEPELIICDEPISALDVSVQAQIVNLLKRLQDEMGLSYLFITHDLSMLRKISQRIAVMYLGSIVELSPAEEIYQHAVHPYTKALLSAIPIADPKAEKERHRIRLSGDIPSPVDLPPGCSFASRCPFAEKRCSESKPELEEIGKDHFAACFRIGELDR